jgi:TetR/AcrR family transcriptional regulator, ethionamide resistance regulator
MARMASVHERRSARREEIRTSLFDAIEQLLEDGTPFSELSVARLIKDAGISRSRFYVYFEDKGDLLRSLSEEVVQELLDATLGWWSLPVGATLDDLRGVTETMSAAYLRHQHLLTATVQVAAQDSTTREFFAALVKRTLESYAVRIAQEQAAGRIDPDVDPYETAALLSWMTEGGFYKLLARAKGRERERLLDALTRIVWNTAYAAVR